MLFTFLMQEAILLRFKDFAKHIIEKKIVLVNIWKDQFYILTLYLYIYTLLICLDVCTSKRLDRSGPNFCVGLHMSTGKVYRWSKFQKFASNKIWFALNVENPRIFSIKSATFFYKLCKEKMLTLKKESLIVLLYIS